MNPWENSKIGSGTISDYLQFANLDKANIKDKIVDSQHEIFNAMDNYAKLAVKIKEDQDSAKVGEFINLQDISSKSLILQKVTDYLKKINDNKKVFMKKIHETSPGNEIYVEQEYQPDFFSTIEVIKDPSLLKIVYQANKIHDSTKSRLNNALSNLPVSKSQVIIDMLENNTKELIHLKNKY